MSFMTMVITRLLCWIFCFMFCLHIKRDVLYKNISSWEMHVPSKDSALHSAVTLWLGFIHDDKV